MSGLGHVSGDYMKIVQVINSLSGGGAEVLAMQLHRSYLAAGFDGVIGKPYLRDELRMHIQSAVSSGNDISSGNAQN